MSSQLVPAGFGGAYAVAAGQVVKVVNVFGTQVVDFWAHATGRPGEHLGLAQCREVLEKVYFAPGDVLITNRYRPCLTVLEDTSGVRHDTLIAPCSTEMYDHLGYGASHRSCAQNHGEVFPGWAGFDPPQPWNLFMTAAVQVDGEIAYARPPWIPGALVAVRAEIDLTVVVSACPDDHYPTNGGDGSPRDVVVIVE